MYVPRLRDHIVWLWLALGGCARIRNKKHRVFIANMFVPRLRDYLVWLWLALGGCARIQNQKKHSVHCGCVCSTLT